MANAVLAFGDNQTTTTNEDQLTEKNNRRIFNTIMKRSKQIPPHRQPTSNHMSHLLGYSGFANSTHITRGNKTCLRIHCVENHYVRSCDFDGGNDTCVRCAQGTFLADNTSSQQFNHECVTYPECFPDATRSLYPNYCAGQHLMYCKCDSISSRPILANRLSSVTVSAVCSLIDFINVYEKGKYMRIDMQPEACILTIVLTLNDVDTDNNDDDENYNYNRRNVFN
ncbi:hypothetical protein KP79_PYT09981 [Mizuhopecten yessoensis]|uniref:Uncharacterized protein n=1 Tax=Mizuhopecten yessoensis TaxID=6573 RepID=A0A210PMM4_MIZYE|nr:hypothetical protein KP79_PYT09981 [Mizuhopecten yessoensis]